MENTRHSLFFRTIPFGLALSLSFTGVAWSEDEFKIEEAEWKAEDSELKVKGKGERGETVTVSDAQTLLTFGSDRIDEEEWRIRTRELTVAPCRVRAEQSDGRSVEKDVKNAPSDCDSGGGGNTGGGGGGPTSPVSGDFRVLAANDLGMHCADLDYQIFSILPPFNVVHAQVVQRGQSETLPRIVDDTAVDVLYSAASNPNDPAGGSSINTTSQNINGSFKTNYWRDSGVPLPAGVPGEGSNATIGALAYGPLYPGVQALSALGFPDFSALCGDPIKPVDCPSALTLFEPIPVDTGIPVPDPAELFPGSPQTPPLLVADQQHMPGLANIPQSFDRFDRDLPFFVNFGFGSRLRDLNWFAADGIPIMPVDDAGRSNAYPLMNVAAHDRATGDALASLDVVLPVASEADCQNCHVEPLDCLDENLPANIQSDQCNGAAVAQTPFEVITLDDVPPPPGDTRLEQLLNTAKINILRLHDVKHGDIYMNWDGSGALAAAPCDASNPDDPNCLANQTPIQCSRCHYTPALDLTQAGPVDESEQGLNGRQQVRHISMSRAMHGHHGELPDFEGKPLFPAMPAPEGRDPQVAGQVLEETCYQCHPGKRTQCLRGAMFSGGVVCQDCHGDMQQVGNDFTARVSTGNPGDFVLDGSLRVPWAFEPGCQSCHTGDALEPNHPPGAIVAEDGVRLLQAYATEFMNVPGVADPLKVANIITSPGSRFAENQATNENGDTVDVLYRLSTGHGGVMCEGCHNSTHAVWPVENVFANDNVAANQLQGHSGTLVECVTCHEPTEKGLPLNLNGPHGMHPVADWDGPDKRWNDKHKEVFEKNPTACQSCHGPNGEGTVLSRTATARRLECKDEKGSLCANDQKFINVSAGTAIGCGTCHENEIIDDD